MTIQVRAGTSLDDEICGQIVGTAASQSIYHSRLPHAQAVFEDTSPLALEDRNRIVAEHNGRPIAFTDFNGETGHIKYLFTLPDAQGIGAGGALLDAVQTMIGGAISVHVLAVNDVGILWYLRRGFKVVDGFAEQFEGETAAWLRMIRHADMAT